jgi:hypothetical protein
MSAVAETVELTDPSRCAEVRRADTLRAQERERLILEHLPQVRMLARKIRGRLPENVSLDDLVSTGILGRRPFRPIPSRHAENVRRA